MAWQASLARAEGQKVKDDPTLLRKSIKRDEKRKQKSKHEWSVPTRVSDPRTLEPFAGCVPHVGHSHSPFRGFCSAASPS